MPRCRLNRVYPFNLLLFSSLFNYAFDLFARHDRKYDFSYAGIVSWIVESRTVNGWGAVKQSQIVHPRSFRQEAGGISFVALPLACT